MMLCYLIWFLIVCFDDGETGRGDPKEFVIRQSESQQISSELLLLLFFFDQMEASPDNSASFTGG